MLGTDTVSVGAEAPAAERQPAVHVLLNARPLSTVFTGVARYARTLYQQIGKFHAIRVSYFCNGRVLGRMPEQSKDAMSRHFPVWVRHIARRARVVADDKLLRRQFNQGDYDIYHETGPFSLSTSTVIPKVLTIYDLSLITYPECHPVDRVKHFERYFYRRLPTVDHIITISEYIRGEIIDLLGIPSEMVTAIPLATAATFYKRPQQDVHALLRSRKIPDRYILSVGTREPRKNLAGLIRAFSRVDTDVPLLCVGWSGWLSENLPREIEKLMLGGRVKILGHVTDEELALLYNGALMTVYPSLYEGFGLPILEAMACDCPVICSNRSSMPEVAGDAALLIEPEDDADIATGLAEMLNSPELRQDYRNKGRHRVSLFSWEETARRTVDVFRRLAAMRQ